MNWSKHQRSPPQDSPHLAASVYTVFSLFPCHYWQCLLLRCPKLSLPLFSEGENVIARFLSASSKERSPSQSTICPCPSQVSVESLSLSPSLPTYQAPETAAFSWKCSPLYMRIHLHIFFTWDASFLLVANLPYAMSCTSDLFCSYLPLNCILLCKSLLAYLHSQCPGTGNEIILLVFCLLSYKQNHN